MKMQYQQLIIEIDMLTPEMKRQVSEFVASLRVQQNRRIQNHRTVGEYAGQITMSADFNTHLGDDFWLGK